MDKVTPSQTQKSLKSRAEARLAVYPVLTFYYNLPPSEIRKMPAAVKQAYLDALPRFLAQEQLKAIQATSFPNYKKADQQRIQRELQRKASRGIPAPPKTPQQLEQSAQGVGIGVRKVKKGDRK